MAAAALTSEWAARMLELPERERARVLRQLPPRVRARVPYAWELWARPDQVWQPGDELWTVAEAGRGWGKTRWLVEGIRHVAKHPELAGGRKRRGPNARTCGEGALIGLAGRTVADTRETLLLGPSGLLQNCSPDERPDYQPGNARLVWPNGMVGLLFSGEAPKAFLGKNLGFLGLDELAHWPKLAEAVPMFELTLRHGERPRGMIATTPVGDEDYLRFLYRYGDDDAPALGEDGRPVPRENVRIIHGETYANVANLAPDFLTNTVRRFEGTTLGDQELRGLVALEAKDALWKRKWIRRAVWAELVDNVKRVAILIDPAVTKPPAERQRENPPETGLLVMAELKGGDLAVLDDASGYYGVSEWADLAIVLALMHDADVVGVEDNNGGDLVETELRRAIERAKTLGTPEGLHRARVGKRLKIQRLRAERDKATRAAYVVGLWEHGHVWHCGDPRRLVRLEHQLCTWNPNRPRAVQSDRMDACVWGALLLAGDGTDRKPVWSLSRSQALAKIAERLRAAGR